MKLEAETVQVDGLSIHYLAAGEGLPVLLVHGWPTSSFLWRNVIPPIAEHRRVIAIDLPGFGRSDKPTDRKYDFAFYARVLDGFLAQLKIDRLGLVVHDLGGPVGLYWASQNPARVERLALLNTLVYPELSFAARAFITACRLPGISQMLTSKRWLERAMYFGVADTSRLCRDALSNVHEPFDTPKARKALAMSSTGMRTEKLRDVVKWLRTTKIPVRVVYGVKDRILPDIEKTVQRLKQDVSSIEVTALPDVGHFLQEEQPDEIGRLLAEFFSWPIRSVYLLKRRQLA